MAFTPESQNFIKQAPIEKESRPRGFYKALVLDALTVLAALAFSFSYQLYLNNRTGLILPIALFSAFSVLSVFEVLLIKSLKRRTLVLLLEVIALFSFFYNLPQGLLITAFGITLLFSVWGEINARREVAATVEPSYFKVARIKVTKLVSAVALMVIIIYFPKFNARENFLSRETFDSFFTWTSGAIQKIYPEISLTGNIYDFAKNLADYEASGAPGFKNLPVPAQEKVQGELIERTLQTLSEKIKIEVKMEDKVSDVAYQLVSSNVEKIKNERNDEFRIVWTILLFLAVRSFGVIYSPAVALITFFIIHLGLATNFIYVAGETRTKETLTL